MHEDDPVRLLHGEADGCYRINVSGELDVAASTATGAALMGFRRSTCRDVLVDIAGVTFVDAAGSQFLTDLASLSGTRSGSTTVLNAQPTVLRVLILLGRVTRFDARIAFLPPPE